VNPALDITFRYPAHAPNRPLLQDGALLYADDENEAAPDVPLLHQHIVELAGAE
jgi:hypothetical protein